MSNTGIMASGNMPAAGGATAIIGWNAIAASSASSAANWDDQCYSATARTHLASSGDVCTLFGIYSGATGTVGMALYVISGGVPTTRVGSKTSVTIGSGAAWYTQAVSIALTAGVRYGVGLDYYVTESIDIRFEAGPGGTQLSTGDDTGELPATWTEIGTDSNVVSFYAQVN